MIELAVVTGRPVAEIRGALGRGAGDHAGRARREEPALMAQVSGVEMEGMMETLKAVRAIKDAHERKETNRQLRGAAGECAGRLASDLRSAAAALGRTRGASRGRHYPRGLRPATRGPDRRRQGRRPALGLRARPEKLA